LEAGLDGAGPRDGTVLVVEELLVLEVRSMPFIRDPARRSRGVMSARGMRAAIPS
jgi:hypothetical protein